MTLLCTRLQEARVCFQHAVQVHQCVGMTRVRAVCGLAQALKRLGLMAEVRGA